MKIKDKQYDLFNKSIKKDWEKEWKDMPEFVQENKMPFKQLIVSFKNEYDLKKFSEIIDQKITLLTKSISFPKQEKERIDKWVFKNKKE